MSALTAAANEEDGDMIDSLRAENAQLHQSLLALHDTLEMTARAGAAHARALAELEAQVEAIGAGGVGPLIRPQAEQPAVKESLTVQDEPVAWPRDAEQVRAFMGTHVAELRYARNDHLPDEQDSYTLSAHDFLTAVEWWADAPYEEKQQDEPVAAQCRFENDTDWSPCNVAHHLLVSAHPKEWPHYETRALYTRPQPKRQPLTDAQIIDICQDEEISEQAPGGHWCILPIAFTRAIERAHGIEGKA